MFNGAAFLRRALDSVFAQTYPLQEIIVIDDGSTNSSPEILMSYGDCLTVVRQENSGVAVARNVGLQKASGDLIAFLDQDDLWPHDRTAAMVDALVAYPQVDVVAGLVEVLFQRQDPAFLTDEDLRTCHREVILGSLCLRTSVFQALGFLSTQVGHADDVDFYWRRREAGIKTLYLDKVSLIYRLHEGNTSSDRNASKQSMLAAVHELFRRRRTGNK